jgi:ATP-dependent DNA helicase RecG
MRLDAVAASTDGFELSRIDLEQRREGDVLGAAQSGSRSHLRLLRVLRDEDLILIARADAQELLSADPELKNHKHLAEEFAKVEDDESSEYIDKG